MTPNGQHAIGYKFRRPLLAFRQQIYAASKREPKINGIKTSEKDPHNIFVIGTQQVKDRWGLHTLGFLPYQTILARNPMKNAH
jgi:hypothetical protein